MKLRLISTVLMTYLFRGAATAGAVVMYLSLLPGFPARAQNVVPVRTVNIEPLNKYAPVQVIGIAARELRYSRPVGFHQAISFSDPDSMWLKNVSLLVLNQSPKKIIALEVQLDVPDWESDSDRAKRAVWTHVGHLPSHALQTIDGTEISEDSPTSIDVPPGHELAMSLADGLSKLAIYPHVAVPITMVSTIWIRLRRVFFEDGTMWVTNSYNRPDEARPGAYVRITADEFRAKP